MAGVKTRKYSVLPPYVTAGDLLRNSP